jgi:NADPH:quinone reductase-like Zn-dependent oxidoreductase
VGSYTIQLARRANIHPLICVAGQSQHHVETLIDRSRGDTIIDYRAGDAAVVQGIRAALGGDDSPPLAHAFDAVSEPGRGPGRPSYQNICDVLAPRGRLTLVLPGREFPEIPAEVRKSITQVGDVHSEKKDLGFVYSRLITRGLEEGWFRPQPQVVIPGGLGGVQEGLEKLRDGAASAVKYIFKISETEGAGKD